MRRSIFVTVILVSCLVCLLLGMNAGRAQFSQVEFAQAQSAQAGFESPEPSKPVEIGPPDRTPQDLSTACALQPDWSRRAGVTAETNRKTLGVVTLERFRRVENRKQSQAKPAIGGQSAPSYQPVEEIVLIDPSNYGDRFLYDLNGNPAAFDPIVVLHETVGSASSAINFFRTPHPRDADQASYHTLIRRNGNIVYLVPPDKRAFGAGNSVFVGTAGTEAVKTHPKFPASVNNFAYHLSLETPADGRGNGYRHSGYTEAQYQSLAWLVSRTGVPNDRITTHRLVDRSQQRIDPRSFDASKFSRLLSQYPTITEISIRCTPPAGMVQPQETPAKE
jgi:hypothetical protein